MTLGPELLGGGGQKQEAFVLSGEGFDGLIDRAGSRFSPFQVVGFIDDEEVPACFDGLLQTDRGVRQERCGAEDELVIQEGIGVRLVLVDGLATGFVEEIDPEVEFSKEFHEPLVHQGFRHQDENPLCPTTEKELVENEAGLNGFYQAYFVSEEETGRKASHGL